MTWSLGSGLPPGWEWAGGGGGFFPAQRHVEHAACGWRSFLTYDPVLNPGDAWQVIAGHACAVQEADAPQ